MKAYIESIKIDNSPTWIARVVSEQDYHERGPMSKSHQTKRYPDEQAARSAAKEWAEEHGYEIYSVDDIV